MATKSLYRSCIEGGKSTEYKFHTRRDKRRERRGTKLWLARLTMDLDDHDHIIDNVPQRTKLWWGHDCQHHQHRALWRFLDTHTGQSWEDVYRELNKELSPEQRWQLDIKESVDSTDAVGPYWFYVDREGILCNRRKENPSPRWKRKPRPTEDELMAWAGDRLVYLNHTQYYWVVPTSDTEYFVTYRQDVALDEEEIAFFESLSTQQKEQVVHLP